MKLKIFAAMAVAALLSACSSGEKKQEIQALKVSENQRFLVTADGKPFMWLGDTGWLLSRLNREQTEQYLENRRQLGFNVVQTSVLHGLNVKNVYGRQAVENADASKPIVTEGNNPADSVQYDYWDHVDYAVDLAAEKGIYVAIVPVWGTNVKGGKVSRAQAAAYAKFLGERYANRNNVVWMNGGDVMGTDSTETWNIIGNTLRQYAPNHLITYHPFGRSRSSIWFHNAPWLDFNMVQSGHRTYEQDPNGIGQDTWKHITTDYNMTPAKPTVDGEPSYEEIPQGLHDWDKRTDLRPKNYTKGMQQPLWKPADVRRYAYWSVFAGAFGFTYGHTSIMQMLRPEDKKPGAYLATTLWTDALNAEGASQMQYMKNLMLSRPFLERVPDNSLVANQGEKYDHIQATRGEKYAFFYTYRGGEVKVNTDKLSKNGEQVKVKASWFNPRNGEITEGTQVVVDKNNNNAVTFVTPVPEVKDGNDWVLILDMI
ncbi:MAG: glycoside hydrolase family 140 protein [Prevotellaceae bacterium]|jgi:hypothetical protein|nr:glycoside hydrolase family 140 protein [Prevotellaceae bacterium]